MNLNDRKKHEKIILEQEERIEQLEAEFKWAYAELAKRIGVVIK